MVSTHWTWPAVFVVPFEALGRVSVSPRAPSPLQKRGDLHGGGCDRLPRGLDHLALGALDGLRRGRLTAPELHRDAQLSGSMKKEAHQVTKNGQGDWLDSPVTQVGWKTMET